jgi:regulator of protease activity HflC (stomatin/prohibitin superfamily)
MDFDTIGSYVNLGILAVIAVYGLVVLFRSIRTTPPMHFRAKLRQGKFVKIVNAPCLVIPFFETVTAPKTMQSEQHTIKVETTTRDKVAVVLELTVAVRVLPGKEREALYNLANPLQQIESHVGKVAFARAPKMDLEDLYKDKTAIVQAVTQDLKGFLEKNGYEILSVNLNDITLPPAVKDARDKVYEQTQAKASATAQGETMRIQIVENAKARRTKRRLNGEGVGLERIAIARAYATSIRSLGESLGMGSATPEKKKGLRMEILSILNKQLDMDTLLNIGLKAKKVLMIPQHQSIAGEFATAQMIASDTK